MTQVQILTGPGTVLFADIKRHKHHKIIISVSNFVSDAIIKIEEIVNSSSNTVNLDELDRSFTLAANGDESYLMENMRIDKLQVNFVSGDAELKVLYEGW